MGTRHAQRFVIALPKRLATMLMLLGVVLLPFAQALPTAHAAAMKEPARAEAGHGHHAMHMAAGHTSTPAKTDRDCSQSGACLMICGLLALADRSIPMPAVFHPIFAGVEIRVPEASAAPVRYRPPIAIA